MDGSEPILSMIPMLTNVTSTIRVDATDMTVNELVVASQHHQFGATRPIGRSITISANVGCQQRFFLSSQFILNADLPGAPFIFQRPN